MLILETPSASTFRGSEQVFCFDGFRVCRVGDLGFRVQGLGFRGLWFRV